MFLGMAHTKLDVYREIKSLIKVCYNQTEYFPESEKFGLKMQIRRAAISVLLNFGEGCGRRTVAERNRFFEISRSSILEVEAAIEISVDLGFLKKDDVYQLGVHIVKCFQMLSKMIRKP